MRVYLNRRIVRRNHNIGRVLVFLGMATLASGFVISFTNPNAVTLVLAAAFAGMIVAQMGISFLNRWGRHPRADEVVSAALKGLDDRFALFHYALGGEHVLNGPSGTFAITPRTESGDLSYVDGKWWQDKPKHGLLRRASHQHLKSLIEDAQREAESTASLLAQKLDLEDEHEVQPLVAFVSDAAHVRSSPDAGPVPAMHKAKLKDWIRRASHHARMDKQQTEQLAEDLKLEEL